MHWILATNYQQFNNNTSCNTQTIYGGSGASYVAYSYFSMIQSSATAETDYLTLLSSCNQMLSDLYNLSIEGINALN